MLVYHDMSDKVPYQSAIENTFGDAHISAYDFSRNCNEAACLPAASSRKRELASRSALPWSERNNKKKLDVNIC